MNEFTQQPGVNDAKLTDWSNAPDIRDLKEDFLAAKTNQTAHMAKIKEWGHLRDVTGHARPKKIVGRSSVQPKLIRRQNEWRYSALTEPFLSSNKLFKISPTSWEDVDSARQNELILNWQFRTKMNTVKFIDEYVRTTVDEGTSIVRLGWNREVEMETKTVPIYTYMEIQTEEEAAALEQAMTLKQENYNEYKNLDILMQKAVEYFEETGVPSLVLDSGETEEIEEEKILKNEPTITLVNPQNVFIDPSCEGDLDKARFVIMSFETSKADLKKDGRYKNLDSVNFEGAGVLAAPDHETTTPDSFQFKDTARKRIVAYEYWGLWDIEGNDKLVPIVATWVGDTLIRMERNPFPDRKAPFVLVPYMPIKRSLFGETDAELLEDNQRILGAVTRGMIDLMARSANGQTGTAKGMLDATNKRRFEAGMDFEYNPLSNHPSQGFVEMKFPEIPRSAMEMVSLQNQEAEALTGVKAFSGGMSGNAYGDVAAGIRGLLDAASKREMAILRRLAKGVQEIGAKIVMMNQEFLSEEEVVRVTNEVFQKIRREDLAGQFDLEVDISTAEVDNAKAQDLGFMLQTIGPDMDIGQRNLILSQIAELKRMPTLAHMLRNYQPQPDPLEVEKRQLENEKLKLEIEDLRAKAALNNAKTDLTQAQTDQASLDFVEQETGTKHERDLQKQSAQAQANQNLEVTKALLKSKKPEEKPGDVEAAVGFNQLSKSREPNFAGRGYAQPERQTLAGRQMDGAGRINPSQNISSKYYDPSTDPALNPANNLGR